jgi:hypothetical protein
LKEKEIDKILLNEVIEICSIQDLDATKILSKLNPDSRAHLLKKYSTVDYFMKVNSKYFIIHEKQEKAVEKKPEVSLQKKETELTKEMILKKEITVNPSSNVELLDQFLNQLNHKNWFSLSCVFNKIPLSEKKKLISPHKTVNEFIKNSKYFDFNTNFMAFRLKKSFRFKENLKIEKKQEIKKIEKKQETKKKSQRFIYSLDFETDVNIPIEIGCVKIEVKTGKVVEYFHEFINPGNIQRTQGAEWVSKNIHGLPYYKMEQLTNKSIKTIWNDFLIFIEYEKDPNKILFAKGKRTETNVIKWFKKETNWKQKLKVKDLFEIVRFYEPYLSTAQAMEIELQATRYLEPVRKCKHHSILNPLFHCALEDAYAVSTFIQHGIKKSFSQFLKMGPFKRESINESKRPSKSQSKKPINHPDEVSSKKLIDLEQKMKEKEIKIDQGEKKLIEIYKNLAQEISFCETILKWIGITFILFVCSIIFGKK